MTWRLSFYKTNNDLPFTKSFQNIINDKLMKRIQIKSKTTKQKKIYTYRRTSFLIHNSLNQLQSKLNMKNAAVIPSATGAGLRLH